VGEVEFLPPAGEEFVFAAKYYEAEESGLGEAFIEEVERAAMRIAAFPEHGSSHLAGTRRIVLARFPYSVVYREEAGVLLVVAVAHHRQRPGYWRHR
jgi:toxin ParE1/3/4